MKRWIWMLVIAVAGVLAGCGSQPLLSMGVRDTQAPDRIDEEVNEMILNMDNNGETVILKVEQMLYIHLSGNPTTGYVWETTELDPAVVRMLGEGEYSAAGKEIGGGGEYSFSFQAAAPGETTLTMAYHRDFEEDESPKRTFSINVLVNPY